MTFLIVENFAFPQFDEYILVLGDITWCEPVAQRHQMVSGSLALLLFIGLDLPLGSKAAAPIGNKVL